VIMGALWLLVKTISLLDGEWRGFLIQNGGGVSWASALDLTLTKMMRGAWRSIIFASGHYPL